MAEPDHNIKTAEEATAKELLSGIERIERLHEENRAILDDISDVYGEYKARGYDPKAMKRVVRERRKSRDQRDEENTVFQLYWDAIHGGSDG